MVRSKMEPRDLFDGLVIVLVAVVVYLEVFGFVLSPERLGVILEVLLGQDLSVYLVAAGIFGVVFVGYIAVYLPKKYGKSAPEHPR